MALRESEPGKQARAGEANGKGDHEMTISERIFELLEKRGMSQKEFSEKTGIAQSSISDWKRKKTNPVSEHIGACQCALKGASHSGLGTPTR